MRLAVATWPDVEKYLKTSDVLLLPIGSTEQHGPTGLLGTDFLTADAIALAVGENLRAYVAPPICYGMASHHLAFPGSVTMRPSIYQAMLCEILRSYYHHGFRRFHVVNGHGGNEHSVRAVFQELKHDGFGEPGLKGASFALYNWWRLPEVVTLATELYGDREGFHATPSEVSLTLYLENLAPRPYTYVKRDKGRAWPLTAGEVREIFPDGVMEADPGLARAEHGKRFLDVVVAGIGKAIRDA